MESIWSGFFFQIFIFVDGTTDAADGYPHDKRAVAGQSVDGIFKTINEKRTVFYGKINLKTFSIRIISSNNRSIIGQRDNSIISNVGIKLFNCFFFFVFQISVYGVNDIDAVYKSVPQKYFPSDVGGKSRSLEALKGKVLQRVNNSSCITLFCIVHKKNITISICPNRSVFVKYDIATVIFFFFISM